MDSPHVYYEQRTCCDRVLHFWLKAAKTYLEYIYVKLVMHSDVDR